MQLPTPQGTPQPQMPPQGGTGAATTMRPMMGSGAQSMSMVRAGVEALQKSLIGLPMGSELHTAVLKAISDISRRMESGGGDHAATIQALSGLARETQSNPHAEIMQKMMGGGAGGQPQPPNMGQ